MFPISAGRLWYCTGEPARQRRYSITISVRPWMTPGKYVVFSHYFQVRPRPFWSHCFDAVCTGT